MLTLLSNLALLLQIAPKMALLVLSTFVRFLKDSIKMYISIQFKLWLILSSGWE